MKPIYLSPLRRLFGLVCLLVMLTSWFSLGWPPIPPYTPTIHPTAAAPTYEQSGYRWFGNKDSTEAATALIERNTPLTLTSVGQAVRLRMLLHVGGENLPHWATKTVDTIGDVGQYTSIDALDAATLYTSYHDVTNSDLKFAKTTDRGGTWTTVGVDTAGTDGTYSSIDAVDANTIYISYYNIGNGNLRYAKSTNGGTTWNDANVDQTNDIGQYTSIAAPSSSTVYISYYDVTNADLRLAKSTDGGNNWTPSAVDTTGIVGRYTSIETTPGGALGETVFISYYDGTTLFDGNLKFAKSTDGGSNWAISTIDSISDVGYYTSLKAIDSNTLYLTYYDAVNGDLKLAKSIDGGGSWAISTIESTNNVGQYSSISALDSNNLMVSHYDVTNGDLRIAKSTDAGANWTSEAIDTASNVGQYSSMAFVDYSSAYITYYDATVGNQDLKFASLGGQHFKLQFSPLSQSVCGAYSDVTNSTAIAFKDNPTPVDGQPLITKAGDPTHGSDTVVNQSYEEGNNFTNTVAAVPAGQDGHWDFSLYDNGAPQGTSYCFRAVQADGSLLSTYTHTPQLTTVPNNPPNLPTGLTQKRGDTQAVIPTGGWANTTLITFEGSVTDPDSTDTVQLCVGMAMVGSDFTSTETCSSLGGQGVRTVTIGGTVGLSEGSYHWRARSKDNKGSASGYQCYPDPSCNDETDRDFGIDVSVPSSSDAVVRDGRGNDVDSQQGTATLSANWSGFSDSLSGIERYEYKIVRDSDGKCLSVDSGTWVTCDSWKNNGGSTSFTLNNPPISIGETYSVGVRAIDAAGNVSGTISSDGLIIVADSSSSTPPPADFTEQPPSEPPTIIAPPPQPPPPGSEILEQVRDILTDNPVSKLLTDITPVVAPITVATGILTALLQVPLYLSYLWSILLEYLGLKRRRRSWGVVYNAVTKEPLGLVVIQLLDAKTNQLVEQRVTDPHGRFGFLVRPGRYRINAIHPEFVFPSRVSPQKGDFRYTDLYHGEELVIEDPNTPLTMNIPLDPEGAVAPSGAPILSRPFRKISFRRLSTVLLVTSLILQSLTVFLKPTDLNIALLATYLGALFLSRYLFHRRPKSWGVVYDVVTKKEVPGAEIYITEEGNPRFSSRKVTDASGRIYLLLPPGKYHLFVQHPEYRFPALTEGPGYKGEVIEVTPDQPLVHIDIPVERLPGAPMTNLDQRPISELTAESPTESPPATGYSKQV